MVNSPGPDCGATVCDGGAGAGLTGPELVGAAAPWLENVRVNSPGPDCAPGAPNLSDAADETWEGGAGAGETRLFAAGEDSLDALPPIELNMRVNAPGPDCSAGAPGFSDAADENWEGSAGETGLPAVEIPTVASFGGFSIVTGLNTRATSFARPLSDVSGAPDALDPAFDPALPPAPGIVSACSMRVNSPGLGDASAPAAGIGAGSFTGSAAMGAAGDVGTASLGSSAFSAFVSGIACPSNEASKSSSARGAACTCPKTPVALDGRSVPGEPGGSKGFWGGFLGASMRSHLA